MSPTAGSPGARRPEMFLTHLLNAALTGAIMLGGPALLAIAFGAVVDAYRAIHSRSKD